LRCPHRGGALGWEALVLFDKICYLVLALDLFANLKYRKIATKTVLVDRLWVVFCRCFVYASILA